MTEMTEEPTKLDEDLILFSIALDIAVICLEKISGKDRGKWLAYIEAEAMKAFAEVPPKLIKELALENRCMRSKIEG